MHDSDSYEIEPGEQGLDILHRLYQMPYFTSNQIGCLDYTLTSFLIATPWLNKSYTI